MASYHCTVKAGSKGKAGPHADYIAREGKYAPELARGKSKLEDLEHTTSGNMPAWAAHDAGIFWRAADEHERANGATYREIEIALPRELNPEQRRALVDDFISRQIGDRHAFTFAIHIPKASIEKGDQPHCHLMYSERTLDGIDRDPEQYFKRANSKNPEKGGCKKDSAGTKERLLETRELWAKVQNAHLEKAGCEDRVSHLSLKAQGIHRAPEKHLGHIDAQKIDAAALVESRAAERELDQAREELAAIDISGALAQAQREAAAALAAEQAWREAETRAAEMAASIAKARATANLVTAAEVAKQEKEDESVRATAIAALAKSSRATDFNIEAADRTSDSNRGVIESSRSYLVASAGVANERRRDLASAVQGAERRVARSHLEGCTQAVGKQLGRVSRVLQQLVDRLPNLVHSIATAAKAVVIKFNQKAITHDRANHSDELKLDATVHQVDTTAFDKTGLVRRDDLDLVQRAKALYSQPKADGFKQYTLVNDIRKAMMAAVIEIRETEPKSNPFGAEHTIKAAQNKAALEAGQPEPWKPGEGNCTWYVLAAQRQRELDAHTQTQRPSGLFSGSAGKDYDAKTAGLTSQIDNIKRATAKLEAELRAKVAEQAQQAQKIAQNGPQHAAAQERHAGLTLLHKAVGEAGRQIETKQEKTKERSYDRGVAAD